MTAAGAEFVLTKKISLTPVVKVTSLHFSFGIPTLNSYCVQNNHVELLMSAKLPELEYVDDMQW